MKRITLNEAANAVNGRLVQCENGGQYITNVAIDNRRIAEGGLFVPIKGERFDGHSFIDAAFEAGAVCTLSEREPKNPHPHIIVKDSRQAFLDLAEYYRGLLGVRLVAVTGSVGKTTTKEMIAAVLEKGFSVKKSEGNLNNQTGVPQTLFGIEPHHEAAVVEMGTNHFGEIASIAKAGRPDICVFTNIGDAHIEFLGSREGVLKAKCEMLPYMRENGTIIANGDDALLRRLKNEHEGVITYGFGENCDVRAVEITHESIEGTGFFIEFGGRRTEAFVNSPGRHMVLNALAAYAVGKCFDMDDEKIALGIGSYSPIFGRMLTEKVNGLTLLNDAYNANPSSVKASLDALSIAKGRRVAILGDMLELGDDAPMYHAETGAYALKKGIECVICVGTLSRHTFDAAKGVGVYFESKAELLSRVGELVRQGDTVLIKGSRGMALEDVAERLRGSERN